MSTLEQFYKARRDVLPLADSISNLYIKITMDEIGEKQFSISYENYNYQDGTDKNIKIETSGLFTNYYHLWEQQKSSSF